MERAIISCEITETKLFLYIILSIYKKIINKNAHYSLNSEKGEYSIKLVDTVC